jgi:hypothetical protein
LTKTGSDQGRENSKKHTCFVADGVKWRTRPDGTRVKIVRKACPEGEELRSAVQEMATEAGWSDHKLTSRLRGKETRVLHYNFILKIGMQHHFAKTGSGQTYPDRESTQKRDRCVSAGFQGEEQGYRSVWLLLRKEQKTKAKLDKLKSVGSEAVPTAVAPTAVAPMSAAPTAAAEPQQQQAVVPVAAAALASAAPQAAESRESLAAPAVAVAVAPESGGTVQQPGEEEGESATTTEGHVASEPAAAAAAAAAAPAPAAAVAACCMFLC